MEKLLVLTMTEPAEGMWEMVSQAMHACAFPGQTVFGFPFALEDAIGACPADVKPGQVLFAEADTFKSHKGPVLVLSAPCLFEKWWDGKLRLAFHRVKDKKAILTAIPADANGKSRWPYAPAALCRDGWHLTRGMPLLMCRDMLRTPLLSPHLLYARGETLSQLDTASPALSMMAYLEGLSAYLLPTPVVTALRPLASTPLAMLRGVFSQGEQAASWQDAAGLFFGLGHMSASAASGIYGPVYHPQPGIRVRLMEKQRAFAAQDGAKMLFVTMFENFAEPGNDPDTHYARFECLARLGNLPLLAYVGEGTLPEARQVLPNVKELKDKYLLPAHLLKDDGLTRRQYFSRSKFALLQAAQTANPFYDYYVYIDFSYLRHPLYDDTAFSFKSLAGGKIHIASVNGKPDSSMIVVPRRRLPALCQEALAKTLVDAQLGQSLEEAPLLDALMEKHPDWFETHVMEQKRQLLSLTLYSPNDLIP